MGNQTLNNTKSNHKDIICMLIEKLLKFPSQLKFLSEVLIDNTMKVT